MGATVARGFADAYAAKKLASARDVGARGRAGSRVTGATRRGKLLVLETDGVCLGMRFGMTGVLLIDEEAGIDGLFYGPHAYRAEWIRGGLEFTDGRRLLLHDPRRLARFEIDPDLDELGPDAITLTRRSSTRRCAARGDGPAVKARLLDQSRRGRGRQPAGRRDALSRRASTRARGRRPRRGPARRALPRVQGATMRGAVGAAAASHTGDHMDARVPGGLCPRDGAAMLMATIGGRTTYWCSLHQR